MQKTRLKDNEGNLTTYAIYKDCKFYVGKRLKKLPTGVTNRKEITWREFSKIIRLYWKYTFEEVVEGKIVKLRNGLGKLMVVKTLCVDYNPKKLYIVRDENGKIIGTEKRKIDVERFNGYFYFILFESKMYKRFRIFPTLKIRQSYMERVEGGQDYLDITK